MASDDLGAAIRDAAGREIGRTYEEAEVRELLKRFENAPGFPRTQDGVIDYDEAIRQVIGEDDRLEVTPGMAREMTRRDSDFVYAELVHAFNRYLNEREATMQRAIRSLRREMGDEAPRPDTFEIVLGVMQLLGIAWLAAMIVRRLMG